MKIVKNRRRTSRVFEKELSSVLYAFDNNFSILCDKTKETRKK